MSVAEPVIAVRSPGVPSTLLGRRLARIGFGAVLALSPAVVLAGWVAGEGSAWGPAPLLALVWVCALCVGAVAGAFGRSRTALSLFDAHAFATTSYVVPAVGVAVAGPLSVHNLVGLPLWAVGMLFQDASLVQSFAFWVKLSLFGTVHVHIAFALAMAWGARQLAYGNLAARVRLWPAVLLSLVPGIVIVFPPFLVLGTGALVAEAFLAVGRTWHRDDLEASLC